MPLEVSKVVVLACLLIATAEKLKSWPVILVRCGVYEQWLFIITLGAGICCGTSQSQSFVQVSYRYDNTLSIELQHEMKPHPDPIDRHATLDNDATKGWHRQAEM